MTANPIDLVGGLATSSNVSKVDLTAWAKARVEQVLADATEIRNTTLSGQLVVQLKSNGVRYIQDTTDTTTADDGVSCIISLDGKRFKPVSSVPAPTTVSLGGVFASAAVANQFLTGLDTAGNLLRRQPTAADLSDGNTGTGAVVHTAGAALSALTALGIRSTGAAFDVKFASSEVLTATRTLALVMGDANRVLSLAGDLTTAGAFALTLTQTGATNVTLPTTGTLATRAGAETLTNKSVDASANTITNLTTAMFAANVVDTDGTLAANSDTRLASQKAVKTYVDTVAQGLDPKQSVLNATTANITLSGEQTIDGQLTSASRILVKNQTTTSQNGIYVTGSGAWTRALDFDAWTELPGSFVFVEEGTTFGDTGWVCTVDAGGTIGSTAVTFTQFSGAGTYTASTGLTLTGTAFSIDATVATLTGAQALTNKTYNGNTWTAGTGTLTLAAGKTLTGSNTLTLAGTDATTITFQGTDTYVGRGTTDTLTNKTLTAPTINGGTHDGHTSFGLRSTGAAFDLKMATAEVLTATRTLSWVVADAARTITLGGNLTVAGSFSTAGAFAQTLTATGVTNVTLPTTGTLATLAGTEAFTNKTYNGNSWTAGTGTLAIGVGKTLTASNTLTFTGTDGSTVSFGAGGTAAYAGATSTGDANYTILTTDRLLYHTALTAARTDTLPAANSVTAGQLFVLNDFRGVVTASNTVTLQRAGSDTINGVASVVALAAQYAAGIYWSDGVSRWTYFPASSGGGSGTVTNVATSGLASGGPITSTGTITVTAAAKSDQTTGTSNAVAVTPLHQQDHDSAAKAWVFFTQSGTTVTVQSSYNVSGIVRNSTGDYTATFTTAFTTANYVAAGSAGNASQNLFVAPEVYAAGTYKFVTASAAGAVADVTMCSLVWYGRQ